MSKMDAMRAMREARYAATQPRAAKPAARPTATPKVVAAPADARGDEQADGLCGHRNMSGRTCTRDKGHAAKSHRYS